MERDEQSTVEQLRAELDRRVAEWDAAEAAAAKKVASIGAEAAARREAGLQRLRRACCARDNAELSQVVEGRGQQAPERDDGRWTQ